MTIMAKISIIILSALLGLICCGGCVDGSPLPTLYEVDEDSEVAKPVMIPVASTAIPLHDLPELKVGFGFGYDKKKHIVKPSNLRDIQLITAKNQHRFVAAAGVQELSKEEFEQFNL